MSFSVIDDDLNSGARITVFGVGGGGGNAIQHMIASNVTGVKFVCANTDKQALERIDTDNKIQLGEQSTRGLGAGANPEVGKVAAEESIQEIRAYLENTDMIFITAGMGGGTGTGAAPVIAKMAKDMGILTIGVVTTPFNFEGKRRLLSAEKGVEALEACVDSLIVIPNQRLLKVYRNIGMTDAYQKVDDVLLGSVRNIADLIIRKGYINLDFADIKAAMSNSGYAMMGVGLGKGESRAALAAQQAINSPLLEGVTTMSATSLIINITSAEEPEYCVTLEEVDEITNIIGQIANEDTNIFFGTAFDPELKDGVRVSVVATGLMRNLEAPVAQPRVAPVAQPAPVQAPVQSAPVAETYQQPAATAPAAEPKKGLSIKDFLR